MQVTVWRHQLCLQLGFTSTAHGAPGKMLSCIETDLNFAGAEVVRHAQPQLFAREGSKHLSVRSMFFAVSHLLKQFPVRAFHYSYVHHAVAPSVSSVLSMLNSYHLSLSLQALTMGNKPPERHRVRLVCDQNFDHVRTKLNRSKSRSPVAEATRQPLMQPYYSEASPQARGSRARVRRAFNAP